jgi:putative transcription factor
MNFMDQIKNKREQLGISQLEMASKLNVSQVMLSRWERGDALPRINEAQKMAEIVGMNLVLVDGSE